MINQFLRSGTSIGANIREAFYAHGKVDFIAKLEIALKEASDIISLLKLQNEVMVYAEYDIYSQNHLYLSSNS